MLKLSMDLNLMKDNVKNLSQDMKIIYILCFKFKDAFGFPDALRYCQDLGQTKTGLQPS